MSSLRRAACEHVIRLDDPEVALDLACQDERSNWVAGRLGLPTVGCKLVNLHGIEWIVQNHAAAPTYDSLQRWRKGDVQPQEDLYPVVAPTNLSPKLTEFIAAIDRCTTKTFAILDTMPGRRHDGHVPGGNSIDTLCHPNTNLLFLDAARVHETIIAHEFGHAWVQYVDGCEDQRTLEDASDPQRMRHVSFVQSFVLDLKVNDLLRRKGFDMAPIEEDQSQSVSQLAAALESGYRPEHPREEVFMALLVADQIHERERGRERDLVRFDTCFDLIRSNNAPLLHLAESLAATVAKYGYESHTAILSCIDECLIATFEHCQDKIDFERELVLVSPEEPNLDKFPEWLTPLAPRSKCMVGKHMARNDISSEWSQYLEPSVTNRARVLFASPDHERSSRVTLSERIGPPTRYSDLPEEIAEMLAMKHLNQTKSYQLHGGPPHKMSDLYQRSDMPTVPHPPSTPSIPGVVDPERPRNHSSTWGGRPYMSGLGRFLTAARLAEQLGGEHPYAYAFDNPASYVDPQGLQSRKPLQKGRPAPWDSAACRRAHDAMLNALTPCFDFATASLLADIMQCVAYGESGCDPTNSSAAVNGTAYGLYQLGDKEIKRCLPPGCRTSDVKTQIGCNTSSAIGLILWLQRTLGGDSIGMILCRYWGVLDCPGHHGRQGHQTSDCLHAKNIDPYKTPLPEPNPGCDPCGSCP